MNFQCKLVPLLRTETTEQFEARVNELCAQGWEPVGAIETTIILKKPLP